jgi:O-antigen/teichoic acid export membrane protein
VTSIGGQLLVTVLKFVTRTVFIHTLGKSYLGINGLFSEILTMLSLTELGIDTAINFKLYKPLAEGDDKRVRVLMKFYKQAYRVIGVTILVLGLCLIPLLPHLIRDYDTLGALGIDAALIFVIYLMQSVSSYLFFAYRSAVMKANQKTYVLDIAEYAVNLATNIVQILVLVFLKNFVLYTVTIIVFNILKNLVNAVIATRYYPRFFIKEPDSLSREEIFGLIKDCGALFVYKLNNVVVKATDNTVISTFLGLTMVGLYSNYLLFYTTIKSLLDRLFTAAKASTGNLFATGTIEKKYRFFQVMNFLSAVLFGTAGVGVAVCADEIIKVWVGRDYLIAPPFAVLVGIEVLFHGMKVNLGQVRNVTGIFRQMWFRPVLGVIVNLGVSIWLVNVCGIYGVIIGTITADILTNFLVDPSVIHKYSFENRWPVSEYYRKNVAYLALIAIICAVDMQICRHFFVGHGWYSVIVHVVIVGVSVPGVFALLYWRSGECRYLVGILNRIISKVFKRGRQAI